MDLLAYFRVLRQHWLLIAVATLVGAGLGAASTALDRGSSDKTTYYRATHTLVYNDPSPGDGRHYGNSLQFPILTTTGDVPANAAKTLGFSASDGRKLATRITTTLNRDSNSLDITAIDADPQRAVKFADTFAKTLIDTLSAKELDAHNGDLDRLSSRVKTQQALRDQLFAQIQGNSDPFLQAQYQAAANQYSRTFDQYLTVLNAGAPVSALSTLESAQPIPISSGEYHSLLEAGETGRNNITANPNGNTQVAATSGSSFDDPVSRGVLGGFLGFLAGIGLALLAHKLDRRLRTREDAEAAFGLPVLAEVPRLTSSQQRQHEVVAVSSPLSRAAEAYRAVRTSLLFQHTASIAAENGRASHPAGNGADAPADSLFEPNARGPLVVMIASAAPGEGKTTTCANLAAVFAEAGSSVLLLNCDFRRPAAHEMFRVDDEPRRVQDTAVPGVKIVTNVLLDPAANPSQVVAAQRQVINAARGRFDVVMLDTAPLLTANDAVEVVGTADLVLLVARPEVSTIDSAERAIDLLHRLDAPLTGVVLVAAGDVSNDYYYYYQRGRVPGGRGRRTAKAARANGKVEEPPGDASELFWQPDASEESRPG